MIGYGFGAVGWLWMLGGLLVTAGVVICVVVLVWALVNAGRSRVAQPPRPPEPPTPLDILRERYARGDISEEEFEHAREVLGR